MTGVAVEGLLPVRAVGLSEDEAATLGRLLERWASKRQKNALLGVYFDAHRPFRDLGISVPPQMASVRAALGWPAKAVRALVRKHQFEGFSLAGDLDPFDVGETLAENSFDVEFLQALSSTYKHSFSLLTSTAGDSGEPDVVIQARDAEWSSALWDKRRREVEAALTITDADDYGVPTSAVLYLRGSTIRLERSWGVWKVERLPNPTGRTLVEVLPHDPQLSRPFGRSRITREVRYLTDAAIRTLMRAETGAEFFASPQRHVLGAHEDAFKDETRWTAITGRVLALSANEEGDLPQVGQFQQMSMEPHLSMYRQLAQNFCAETSLPMSAVGLFTDSPASAEAMQAAEAQLAEDAEYQWRVFRPALLRLQQNVVMLRDGTDQVPTDSWRANVNWTPARWVSPQAASDFVVKAVAAMPELAQTSVMMRRLGLSQGEIDEILTELTRANASGILDRVLAAAEPLAPAAVADEPAAEVTDVVAAG